MISAAQHVMRARRPWFSKPFVVAGWITFFYALLELLVKLLIWLFHASREAVQEVHATAHSIEATGLIVVAGFYGMFRVNRFHPLADTRYARWLTTTPWKVNEPLPMGPVHLVWEDLIVLAVIAAGTWLTDGGLLFLMVFSIAYTALLLICGWRITHSAIEYLTLFGWATAVLFWNQLSIAVPLAIFLVIVSQWGVWNGLAKFPWQTTLVTEKQRIIAMHSTTDWAIGPLPPPKPMDPLHSWLLPVLIGWWIFCALWRIPDAETWPNQNSLFALVIMGILFLGLIRWGRFCARYQPPISTWGRLWTWRWIIPGYDYVLLAPLSTTLTGILLLIILSRMGVNPAITLGIVAATVLACLFNLPPTLRHWQLTGHHRILAHPPAAARRQRGKRQPAEQS
jgi:hypothetical protein